MRNSNSKIVLFQCVVFALSIWSCSKVEPKDNILDVAGIKEQDARVFYEQMKNAVLSGKKETVAGFVHFPIGANIGGKHQAINNSKEFMNHYDEIINSQIKDILMKTKFEDLKPNFRGLFVGDGQIIFGGVGSMKQYVVLITSFNN